MEVHKLRKYTPPILSEFRLLGYFFQFDFFFFHLPLRLFLKDSPSSSSSFFYFSFFPIPLTLLSFCITRASKAPAGPPLLHADGPFLESSRPKKQNNFYLQGKTVCTASPHSCNCNNMEMWGRDAFLPGEGDRQGGNGRPGGQGTSPLLVTRGIVLSSWSSSWSSPRGAGSTKGGCF